MHRIFKTAEQLVFLFIHIGLGDSFGQTWRSD